MFLPAEIIPVIACFRPAFTETTYQKVVELLVGTVLARGRRTVASALRTIGKGQTKGWSKYHHVLNRAKWSGLQVSRLLLMLLVTTFVPSAGTVTIAVDETLERRWGPRIRHCGHWRDSRASSKRLQVSSRGLRWLVFAVVVHVPWTAYALALPFLSVLLTTPKVSATLGNPHRTVAQVTGRIVRWLRRTLTGYPIHLVGDGAYAVLELGLTGQAYQADLFLQPDPATWGVNYMLRTGSDDFAHRMVTPRRQGGYMPDCYHVQDARVWDADGQALATPEEEDVFRLWQMDCIAPEARGV